MYVGVLPDNVSPNILGWLIFCHMDFCLKSLIVSLIFVSNVALLFSLSLSFSFSYVPCSPFSMFNFLVFIVRDC